MHIQTHIQLTLSTQYKHTRTLPKLPRLINLSNSKFLYPYLTHKSTNASSALDKELHFSLLCVFFSKLLRSRLGTRPPENSLVWDCLSVRKKHSLFCPFCSYHHPTLKLPQNFHSQKASPNLIILVFHQVERFGRWRIGI